MTASNSNLHFWQTLHARARRFQSLRRHPLWWNHLRFNSLGQWRSNVESCSVEGLLWLDLSRSVWSRSWCRDNLAAATCCHQSLAAQFSWLLSCFQTTRQVCCWWVVLRFWSDSSRLCKLSNVLRGWWACQETLRKCFRDSALCEEFMS